MLSLGSTGLEKVEINRVWPVRWQRDQCVTWLCGWGSLILTHHPAKFGVHKPCESGDITSFICHVTTISKCHMTFWMGSSHPNNPTKFGVHGHCESGDIMFFICHVTTASKHQVTLWVASSHTKSPPCNGWNP